MHQDTDECTCPAHDILTLHYVLACLRVMLIVPSLARVPLTACQERERKRKTESVSFCGHSHAIVLRAGYFGALSRRKLNSGYPVPHYTVQESSDMLCLSDGFFDSPHYAAGSRSVAPGGVLCRVAHFLSLRDFFGSCSN
eukprot:3134205-Amphidinium_carterae.1